MKIIEHTRKQRKTKPKAEVEEMLKKMRKEWDKLVKGCFEFTDAQGGWIEFTHRYFPDQPIQQYHFVHGEVCEIPLGIVRHLNNTVKKVRKMNPEIAETGSIRGVPASYEVQSRIKFTPVDFV